MAYIRVRVPVPVLKLIPMDGLVLLKGVFMGSTITFGFEVECLMPEGSMPVLGEHGSGTNVPWLPGWRAERDGSLREKQGYKALEFVSPVFSLEQLPAALRDIQTIKSRGAIVNSSCGGHIHVGLQHWLGVAPSQSKVLYFLLRCIEGMARVEDGIFAYSGGEARQKGTFCTPAKAVSVEELSLNTLRNGTRYTSLNTAAYWRHGTIEFRLFDGSVDSRRWATNLSIALRLIESVEKDEQLPLLGMNKTSLEWLEKWAGVTALVMYDVPLWYVEDNKIVQHMPCVGQRTAWGFRTNRAAWYYREYLKRREVYRHQPFTTSGWERYLIAERAWAGTEDSVPEIVLPDLNTCWDDVDVSF